MSKKVFSSICDPIKDIDAVSEVVAEARPRIKPLLLRYLPSISTIPLFQGMSWRPTWKSLPTFSQVKEWYLQEGPSDKKSDSYIPFFPSVFSSLLFEMSAYTFLIEHIHSFGDQWSPGILWYHRTRFPFDNNN